MQQNELISKLLNKLLIMNLQMVILEDENENIIYTNINQIGLLEIIKNKIKSEELIRIKETEYEIIKDNIRFNDDKYNLIILKDTKNKRLLEAKYCIDAVTNLPNRRIVNENLQRLNEDSYIIMGDIDHFKKVNDTIGHFKADYILRLISNHLREGINREDFVGRYGGEEFLFILRDQNDEDAINKVERIRKNIENLVFYFDGLNKVTISFGICKYNKYEKVHFALNKADIALYESKKNGRNLTSIYNDSVKILKKN